MKILIFVPNLTFNEKGHVPVFFQTRIEEYLNLGHEVEVITHSCNRETIDLNGKIIISEINKNDIYEALRERVNKIDLFLVHFVNYRIIKFLLNYNIKTTIFFHGVEAISSRRYFFDWKIRLIFYLKKFIFNKIQFYYLRKLLKSKNNIKYVFVSNWMKHAIEKDLKLDFSKSQNMVIHNSVSSYFLNSNYQINFTEKKINVLILKNFSSYKYAGDLTLKYLLKLSKTKIFEKFNFTIAGSGFILNKYKNKLSKFKNIKILDEFFENRELIELYKKNHIFLYLSRLDAQSVSVSEALSFGMLVVSSDVAALPEFIQDGYNGFLIKNEYQEFYNKMKFIIENKDLLNNISIHSKKFSLQKFSPEINIKKELLFADKIIQCSKCLVDSNISEIYFDDQNICSYCKEFIPYLNNLKNHINNSNIFYEKINLIKDSSVNKKYDSLIGISGGVDSSYLVHLAKKNNLNPLLVHFDNGWNSELAISNINNLINKTNFDLKTVVVNWEEFRDIQLSFLKAGVIDIELVTDHAIFANLLDIASKYKIKNILSGTNIMTEHAMPLEWIWRKTDLKNIKDIHKKEGSGMIKTYPRMHFLKWYFNLYILKKFNVIELLNFINYKKKEAIKILESEYNWRSYDEKHYESIFTKFYQSYILPEKFNINKKIVHYSSLIRNGEISRSEALEKLNKNYQSQDEIEKEKKYIASKFSLSTAEFEKLISKENIRSHFDYKNSEFLFQFLKKLYFKFK